MFQGVKKHEDDEELPGCVMELPEKPSERGHGGDFLHVLEHISQGPVLKTQDDS